jgi:hypothetical protein
MDTIICRDFIPTESTKKCVFNSERSICEEIIKKHAMKWKKVTAVILFLINHQKNTSK